MDDHYRIRLQMIILPIALSIAAFVFSIINYITNNISLMIATAIFGVIFIIPAVICYCSKKSMLLTYIMIDFDVIILLTYLIIVGGPEGFSPIWVFLLPSAGFLATGKKNGTITSLALFGILVILLWTPIGEIALRYNYTLTFKMRFPFLYLVFFVVGYLVETIRAKLSDQIVELKEKYEHLSKIDSLTDIENRYSFNIDFEDVIKHNNKCSTLGLLILDIDYFKKVNDVFGHAAGDMVLIKIANVLKAICNGNDGIACRWGGEEFTALFFNITKDELLQKAETVRSQVESMTIPFGEATIHVTVSVGATCMEVCNVKDCDFFVTIADKSLYQAKENGRNQVCYLQDKQSI